jgi:glutathione S-transferase
VKETRVKLYFSPGACSLSSHIVLRELALPFELVRVNNKTKKTAEGGNFLEINPKGYVAALALESGEVLTEAPAIMQYLADQKPEAGIAPAAGTIGRVRLQEWLNFVGTELHARCSPLFNSTIPDEVKTILKETLIKRINLVAATLEKQDYLLGARFTAADAYLFTVMRWTKVFAIDLNDWPSIVSYMARVGARPAVVAALEAEAATAEV